MEFRVFVRFDSTHQSLKKWNSCENNESYRNRQKYRETERDKIKKKQDNLME